MSELTVWVREKSKKQEALRLTPYTTHIPSSVNTTCLYLREKTHKLCVEKGSPDLLKNLISIPFIPFVLNTVFKSVEEKQQRIEFQQQNY